MHKCIAIIPARGGSSRLPRKNILKAGGKNLIAYPITAAQQSELFDGIYVSTEDAEIREIATSYGAEVIDRSEALNRDEATVDQVCIHALASLQNTGIPFNTFCCIYATAVLLSPRSLVESKKLLDQNTQFVMGISVFEHLPLHALSVNDDDFLEYKWPEYLNLKTQDFPTFVASNGTFYWAKRDAFEREKTILGSRLKGYVVPRSEVSDINTKEDFYRIKKILEK